MPFTLDFSKPDVFLSSHNRLVRMAISIDDALANSEEFLSAYDILKINPCKESLTNNREYSDFRKVVAALRKYLGKNFESINLPGKLKAYRYAENYYDSELPNRNPFGLRRKITKNIGLEDYIKKMNNLLDFIPQVLLQDIFSNTELILSIEKSNKNKDSFLAPETPLLLSGVVFLPEIYAAIQSKKVLWIKYAKGYKDSVEQRFHPHFLKEYNGRWYAIGIIEAEHDGKLEFFHKSLIALDRIEDLDELEEKQKETPKISYIEYFRDIVGVTHVKGAQLEEVLIKVKNEYVFNLIKTKKIHSSQKEEINDGEHIIKLLVRPNKELETKILSFGSALEVIYPESLRNKIILEINLMKKNYFP